MRYRPSRTADQVFVDGMISNKGKEFSATLQYSAERRGLEFIFPKDQAFNQQSLGGVQLSPTQLKMLSEGHTILVEDMKRRNSDEVFSSFVTLDKVTGRPNYTRHNPETGEIYIPKEICNVQLTHEDKELLRKGQPVFLENMVNRKGEEFSAFVKLNMTTGNPQYSRTPDGFNEQQAPRIPAEVYGHVFTAQERANLPGRKGHSHFRPEKQRKTVQLLPESQPRFRAVAVFPGQSGYPEGHFPPGDTGRQCPTTGAEEKHETGHVG